ncbi:MAG TPA: hypothetical protein VIX82_11615, partial [Solirubrobacteraceae bacterium]
MREVVEFPLEAGLCPCDCERERLLPAVVRLLVAPPRAEAALRAPVLLAPEFAAERLPALRDALPVLVAAELADERRPALRDALP